jgi:hypothetical protein
MFLLADENPENKNEMDEEQSEEGKQANQGACRGGMIQWNTEEKALFI